VAAPANIHAAVAMRNTVSAKINLLRQLPTAAVCLLWQEDTKDIGNNGIDKCCPTKTA
jgi:hypothetical protein